MGRLSSRWPAGWSGIVLTMKLAILPAVLLAGSCLAGVIPQDSRIYVSDENEWLGLVRAAILKANVPVKLIAFPDKADYVLRGTYDEQGRSAWLELIAADGEIVWAERLKQRASSPWNRGASRTLVDRLKKAIVKR